MVLQALEPEPGLGPGPTLEQGLGQAERVQKLLVSQVELVLNMLVLVAESTESAMMARHHSRLNPTCSVAVNDLDGSGLCCSQGSGQAFRVDCSASRSQAACSLSSDQLVF
mmetsp:Transcript_15581/g.35655  ORF Transcript_15581/g.35655 Transcript_15581/m.35655 type:complete len:111 (-) Transcript_15581:449-781(-)